MAERSNRTATGVVHLSGSTFDETVATSRGLLMVDFWRAGAVRAVPSRRFSRTWPRPRVAE